MARNNTQGLRDRGLSLFKRAEPGSEARSALDAERQAMRAKTARLRELRLASEATDIITTEPEAKKRNVAASAATKPA